MRDEFDMRMMEEHRAAFSQWVSTVFDSIVSTLDVLHAKLFEAPWRDDVNRCC